MQNQLEATKARAHDLVRTKTSCFERIVFNCNSYVIDDRNHVKMVCQLSSKSKNKITEADMLAMDYEW
jgi:hypothetical protein